MSALTELSPPVGTDEVHSALTRLLHSEGFRKSPSLSHLLEYLVVQAFELRREHIKEAVIAVEVFDRSDFDGRTDNIVRVQAHRLRKALDHYYAAEGSAETLRFSIPKGSYVPQISLWQPDVSLPQAAVSVPPRRFPHWLMAGIAVLGVATGVALAWNMRGERLPDIPGVEGDEASQAIASIWGPLFDTEDPVKVVYANSAFLRSGDSDIHIRYAGPMVAPNGARISLPVGPQPLDGKLLPASQPLHYDSAWTGIGELHAMHRMTLLGTHFAKQILPVARRSFDSGDLHGANVVLVGIPSVETDQSPIYQDATGTIRARRPLPGEISSCGPESDPHSGAFVAACALLTVRLGPDPGRRILSVSGPTTWSSWTGIDFATSGRGAKALTDRLRAIAGGKIPESFQAIIRADISQGAVSNASLVLVRVGPNR